MKRVRLNIEIRPEDAELMRAIVGELGPLPKAEILRRGLRALTREIIHGKTGNNGTPHAGREGEGGPKVQGGKGAKRKGSQGAESNG